MTLFGAAEVEVSKPGETAQDIFYKENTVD